METKTIFVSDAELKAEGNAGEFVGMAAVYGNRDLGGDVIAPGAFAECISKGAEGVLLYFQHDYRMPVGKAIELTDSARGVRLKGALTPGHTLASDVHAGMKHGTLTGLSVGFMIPKGGWEYDDKTQTRTIRKGILKEVSITNMPMNPKARVTLDSVKSQLDGIAKMSDFEDLLRDAAGFSREAAKSTIASFRELILRDAGLATNDAAFKALLNAVERHTVIA